MSISLSVSQTGSVIMFSLNVALSADFIITLLVGLSNVYTITSAAFSRCCEFLSISFPHLLRNATFGNSINKPYNKVLGASQFKGEILIVKPFPQTPEAHPNLVKPSSKFKDPINSKGTGADTKILWATTHPYTQQLQPQPSPIKFKDPIQ